MYNIFTFFQFVQNKESYMRFFTYAEDKLIMWLTAVCWWTEIHFDKNSRDLANPIMFIFGLFLFSAFTDFSLFASIPALVILCFLNRLSGISHYENASSSPNPNKHNFLWKFSCFAGIIFLSFWTEDKSFIVAHLVTIFSWFYVLCTEPMPPAEKDKRKVRKSLKKLDTKLAN